MNQYYVVWNSQDLSDVLKIPSHLSTKDEYLREMMDIELAEGGMLRLYSLGKTAQDAEALANGIYTWLLEQKKVISDTVCPRELLMVNQTTKCRVSPGTKTQQQAKINELQASKDTIEALTKQIAALTEPVRGDGTDNNVLIDLKEVIKFTVLGGVLGAFLAAAWMCLLVVFRNRVDSSYKLQKYLAAPYLGCVTYNSGLFGKLADKLSGEPHWNDQNQAIGFLSEKASMVLNGRSNILVLSICSLQQDSEKGQILVQALSTEGRSVQVIGDAWLAPETIIKLKDCDSVVLAETVDRSDLQTICALVGHIKNAGKNVDGFVMV